MAQPEIANPYELRPEDIEAPPSTLGGILRRIGPGLILTSAVVGSGELIVTTVLGAENGYALLWLILVSCVIKIFVQHELGRYAIATGETTLEALDRIPGPRLRVSWVVWLWTLLVALTIFVWGGMLGAIGEVFQRVLPAISINAWVCLIALASVPILIIGRYNLVEKVCSGMVIVFTALAVGCAVLLFKLPEYFSWSDLLGGLSFRPPQGGIATAVAVFGITGVGTIELIIYPYWCLEKGYARFAGPRDETAAWQSRAEGWIRVMGFDILNSMVIYTAATLAFYLLGAGVLKGMGVVPQGAEMVQTLSNMYTETLGAWWLFPFLMGSVVVFYSTLFVGVASTSRKTADFLGMLGFYDKRNYAQRLKVTHVFVVVYLVLTVLFFFFVREPVLMVKVGGVAQALSLPVLAFSAIYLRYVHLPKQVWPKGWITLALWLTAAVMAVMTGYSVILQLAP